MVHGAGGGGWEYRSWAPIFRKSGYIVVARDLEPAPGGLEKTTVDDYLRQIAAWVPKKHGRLIFVGASMGGPLALASAARLKADAIVLVNPVPEIGMVGKKSPPVVRWANGPYKDTVDSMPDSDEATRHFAWKHWRDESGTVLDALRAGLKPPKFKGRVLLVISGKDTDIAPALSRRTARRLGATTIYLPQASHVGPLLGRGGTNIARRVLRWIQK